MSRQGIYTTGERYRAKLAAMIRATAKELEEHAEQLAGDMDLIHAIEIDLEYPQDGIPTITLIRTHLNDAAFREAQKWTL
ncbi:MAG: hypothetical protein IKF99_01145 [Oscillospiraceae bacterium]|nr:hypothetical protein [Oscillospiraceae bacterium]